MPVVDAARISVWPGVWGASTVIARKVDGLPVLGLVGSRLTANVRAGWRPPSGPTTRTGALQPETTGTARITTPIDGSSA